VIERFVNLEQLSRAAAEQFVRAAHDAISAHGRFTVALSGGSTPKTMYQELATRPFAARVDWSRVHAFWGDERCVPPDHPESNYRVAWKTLLSHVPIPVGNVHRIFGELPPEQAADNYQQRLRDFFYLAEGEFPRFDLILLGVGVNAHVASLFPASPALREKTRQAVAVHIARSTESPSAWRVTLTFPVINAAANITLLVAGATKAKILHDILDGPRAPEQLPAQLLHPVAGQVHWMVEMEAGSMLK
jgi:6-phosphogluconolactonase